MSPSSTRSEKPERRDLESEAPVEDRARADPREQRKQRQREQHAAQARERVVRWSPCESARRAAAGSPASTASARSVCTTSVHTAATVNAISSGGKSTLSVRFAASVTWKMASATSRNSVRRGRASSSWRPWASTAKCASATSSAPPVTLDDRPRRCRPRGRGSGSSACAASGGPRAAADGRAERAPAAAGPGAICP